MHKIKIKDSRRLLELVILCEGDLNKLDKKLFKEWLGIYLKYMNQPGYEWIKDRLKKDLHDFGEIYYEYQPGHYLKCL